MNRLYPALSEAALASLLLIPYLLHQGKKQNTVALTTAQHILFAIYLSTAYAVAGLPSVLYIRYRPNVNLVPFLYMFSDHTTSLLNVLLFIPLGFFLPVLWEHFRKLHRTVLWGLLISCCIEFLQIFTYRATDINDLITNTCGTVLGYFTSMLVLKLMPVKPSDDRTIPFHRILAAVVCTMFFLQPLLKIPR